MSFSLPKGFLELIDTSFKRAVESGELIYSKSTSNLVKKPNGPLEFLVTASPGLAKKPTDNSPDAKDAKVVKDPFENPPEALTVLRTYGNDYSILLNKFAVVPNHILLITKQFRPQTEALSPTDLLASYKLLTELPGYLAFFNMGSKSGASQPHKHLQFLPLDKSFTPFPVTTVFPPVGRHNVVRPVQHEEIPFAHFIAPIRLSSESDEDMKEDLTEALTAVIAKVFTTVREFDAELSYNVLMTKEWVMAVPRRESEYNGIGVNATGVLGMLLAKNDEQNEYLSSYNNCLKVVEHVGFPNTSKLQDSEYHY